MRRRIRVDKRRAAVWSAAALQNKELTTILEVGFHE